MIKKQVSLNSPRLAELSKKKQKEAKKKATIILIIFMIIIICLSFASRISAFRLKKINISGNKIIETKDIEEVINNEVSGNYLWIFPKNNFLIYPKNKINKELKTKYKRLKDISINLSGFTSLEVNVSEYDGKYLYCGATVPILRSDITPEVNKCYFIDQDGYIFDESPYFSGNVYFKFYGNLDKEDPIGSYFIPTYFSKIISFKENIQKMNLKPDSFFELGGEDNIGEGFISINGEPMVSPYINFKINDDYQKMIENLQAAISTEPLKTDLKTKLSSLLYIDLRFNNKVLYKFK